VERITTYFGVFACLWVLCHVTVDRSIPAHDVVIIIFLDFISVLTRLVGDKSAAKRADRDKLIFIINRAKRSIDV